MPELAKPLSLFGTILYERPSSKSETVPPFQIRKLFPSAGCSLVVRPVIAPPSTDQCWGLPAQPARSLPLKRDLKPASLSFSSATADRAMVAARSESVKATEGTEEMRMRFIKLSDLMTNADEIRISGCRKAQIHTALSDFGRHFFCIRYSEFVFVSARIYFKARLRNFNPFTAISSRVGSMRRQIAAARAMTFTSVVNDSITTSPLYLIALSAE